MKKKILLIFPPTTYQVKGSVEGKGVRQSRALTPHLGLLYIARVLIDSGYPVEFCDFSAKPYSRESLTHSLQNTGVAGITMQSFNRDAVRHILRDIKEIDASIPVMVGGPDCILHPRLVDRSDVTAYGEVEHTIAQIVDAILNGGNLSRCEGVFYSHNGTVRQGRPPVVLENLDDIRFPAREIINRDVYDFAGKKLTPKIATIITSRGCPYRCRFCARTALQMRYRERSVENVLDEIEQIYRSGYQFLAFVDEEFIFKKARIKKIMKGIIHRNIRLRMLVQGRVDSVDEELFALMQEAGVRAIIYGLESGNQETLDYYDKRTTVTQNRLAVELAHKYNLFCFGFFILGAPVETEKHIQDTIDFAMSVPLDGATFNVLDYTYGSELWNQAYQKGLIKKDEFNVPADKDRGLSRFSKEELDKTCLKAFRDFYRRPSLWIAYLRKIIRIREPWALQLLSGMSVRFFKDFLR